MARLSLYYSGSMSETATYRSRLEAWLTQKRLHQAAARCFGRLAGGDPKRAEEARPRVAEKLRGERASR